MPQLNKKSRIWELDVFRGVCILGVVAVHFVYDLVELYQIIDWTYPAWFAFVKNWGGVLFILLSGICATLGSRSVRRGVIVFLCGMLCTLVTYGMYRFGMATKAIIIYFGILHFLGTSMILWWAFKRLPTWALAVAGIAIVSYGMELRGQTFDVTLWMTPLGYTFPGFYTSDYFPLMPYFGFFLLGAVLGRTVYRKQQTLLPQVNERNILVRFFSFCGRQSLWIYLLHQPLLAGLSMLLAAKLAT